MSHRTGFAVAEVLDKEVGNWSSTLPDTYLLCRDMGHTWRPYTAVLEYEAELGAHYHRVLRCGRCSSERRQLLSLRGEIVSGYYSYSEGYVAPKEIGRLSGQARSTLRLESTLRLIGKDEV